ncbi:MAG TPA: type II toxin-antitoxin system RelE/ParE family toxin [Chitinophagales bacterium]|nr:type II toxin-antitoxin system RelE/ParE family toxin [Chitinophagales bacterium]
MAQRKIIWSHRSNIRLYQILDFYSNRNKSTNYSTKLYRLFNHQLSLLINHPSMGIQSEEENIRGLIVNNFILFYEITTENIIIHTVWDCNQNPNDLKII